MFPHDIGIDLGTANIAVFVRGKGIVIREPSVVAVDVESNRIIALGEEARLMIGRTPGNISAVRPLKDGVIADYEMTEAMLKHFIRKACGRRPLFRPQVAVCVPSGVTGVEKRAVLDACLQAGAKQVYLVSEPMAAALGAGLNIGEPKGQMVIDIGGGTTDVAVLSLWGEVVADSLRIGGDKFDEAIVRYIRRELNMLIGERTAEEIKMALGYDSTESDFSSIEIKGRDTVSGLPRTARINSEQTREALAEPVRAIVDLVRSVFERTPPELAGDIIEHGMVLTGGGSLLKGMASLLQEDTGIPVHLAEEPLSCVAMGTGIVLEHLSELPAEAVIGSRSA